MSDITSFSMTNQLLDSNGSRGVFVLPCGYYDKEADTLHKEVEIRAMTGVEEDIFASRSIPSNKKTNMVLRNCVLRIGDLSKEDASRAIPRLFLGDRTYLFFALRVVTHGPLFSFRKKCDECKAINTHTFDLSTLEVFPMADPKRLMYETTLPSGIVLQHRPLTGMDEEMRDQLSKRTEPLTLSILLRVEDFNGRGRPASSDIAALSWRDRDFLRAEFEDIDGGVDTTLELKCSAPMCGAEFESELDPSDPAFFSPSVTQKRLSRRSSSSSRRTR